MRMTKSPTEPPQRQRSGFGKGFGKRFAKHVQFEKRRETAVHQPGPPN